MHFSNSDVKIERTKGSGPGGQHRNKTETAIRAVHIPSRTAALADEKRSQKQNTELALTRLNRKLQEINDEITENSKHSSWMKHNFLERENANLTFKGENFVLIKTGFLRKSVRLRE